MRSPLEHRRPIRDPEVLERMRIAFDLYQVAEDIQRQTPSARAWAKVLEERPSPWHRFLDTDVVCWTRGL